MSSIHALQIHTVMKNSYLLTDKLRFYSVNDKEANGNEFNALIHVVIMFAGLMLLCFRR